MVGLLIAAFDLARGEGEYQRARDGKTLVWNESPKPGDEATWSGLRDRDGFARGFGTLVWFTREPGVKKPALFARYWGNMKRGKFSGPVNVHSKKKTHHALFADGARVTRWTSGAARSRMSPQQIALIAKHNATAAQSQEPEPAPPAQGPPEKMSEVGDRSSEEKMPIQTMWSERWPKIDIDDSLRILAFPPRTLRK